MYCSAYIPEGTLVAKQKALEQEICKLEKSLATFSTTFADEFPDLHNDSYTMVGVCIFAVAMFTAVTLYRSSQMGKRTKTGLQTAANLSKVLKTINADSLAVKAERHLNPAVMTEMRKVFNLPLPKEEKPASQVIVPDATVHVEPSAAVGAVASGPPTIVGDEASAPAATVESEAFGLATTVCADTQASCPVATAQIGPTATVESEAFGPATTVCVETQASGHAGAAAAEICGDDKALACAGEVHPAGTIALAEGEIQTGALVAAEACSVSTAHIGSTATVGSEAFGLATTVCVDTQASGPVCAAAAEVCEVDVTVPQLKGTKAMQNYEVAEHEKAPVEAMPKATAARREPKEKAPVEAMPKATAARRKPGPKPRAPAHGEAEAPPPKRRGQASGNNARRGQASGNNAKKRKQSDIDDQKKEDEPEPEALKQLKLSNLNFKAIKPLDINLDGVRL